MRYVNGSSVSNSLLADGWVIEGTVENCVLFRGVRVKKGAVVRNCVLMHDKMCIRYSGKATGYYSRTGKGSSGLGLGYGTVAVDPSVIPYGKLLSITSTDGSFVYGYAVEMCIRERPRHWCHPRPPRWRGNRYRRWSR